MLSFLFGWTSLSPEYVTNYSVHKLTSGVDFINFQTRHTSSSASALCIFMYILLGRCSTYYPMDY